MIFFIALALAVDAFAVALGAGVTLCHAGFRQTFRLAFHFGLFQAGMNIAGWAAGLSVRSFIEQVDHWVAFGLLLLVGGKMIYEVLSGGDQDREGRDPTRGRTLLVLAVATSIDALAVGLSFAVLNIAIWMPALIIGLVALVLTALGLHLGCYVGKNSRLGPRVEIFGGLVLILIGGNILRQHGVF